MPYLIGIVLALAVCIFALLTGLDRGRVFYATLVLVVAHYYILFAVMGASSTVMLAESVAASVFFILAVIGYRTSPWIIATPSLVTASMTFFITT